MFFGLSAAVIIAGFVVMGINQSHNILDHRHDLCINLLYAHILGQCHGRRRSAHKIKAVIQRHTHLRLVDVLAFYAIVNISVGNTFIACMLTIVGYSINATIVIFDALLFFYKI